MGHILLFNILYIVDYIFIAQTFVLHYLVKHSGGKKKPHLQPHVSLEYTYEWWETVLIFNR